MPPPMVLPYVDSVQGAAAPASSGTSSKGKKPEDPIKVKARLKLHTTVYTTPVKLDRGLLKEVDRRQKQEEITGGRPGYLRHVLQHYW